MNLVLTKARIKHSLYQANSVVQKSSQSDATLSLGMPICR